MDGMMWIGLCVWIGCLISAVGIFGYIIFDGIQEFKRQSPQPQGHRPQEGVKQATRP